MFTSKLIRFWILHLNWMRLNLFLSCFIMVCLHGNCYYSFTVLVAVAMKIHNKVSFNIGCFKNFLHFSLIPFTTSGAQLKEAG